MGEMVELVLLIGDFHIPHRAASIPDCFQELLKTDKIRHVLCTGNVGSTTTLTMLREIAGSVHVVKGDMDTGMDFPEFKVVKIGEFKVGLIHGHQCVPWDDLAALSVWQRRLDCDVLVSGHTHLSGVREDLGKFYINPGSVSGAQQQWSDEPLSTEVSEVSEVSARHRTPSFMLMAVNGLKVALYVYEEKNGKTNVVMSEFSKSPSHTSTYSQVGHHITDGPPPSHSTDPTTTSSTSAIETSDVPVQSSSHNGEGEDSPNPSPSAVSPPQRATASEGESKPVE